MPVIVREGSWRIWIYSDDHGFPHVHVVHPGGRVKIRLTPGHDVLGVSRMSPRDLLKAVRLVETHREILMAAWRNIHGH
ncbi:DUF4160 domain-containing protein [Longimicrobium sp.]|jgi:hypothetical protein|uniref:DUF4160 domain-containing protein n=1 Tax=Longimicrobium sp. TaxID=2029185 RepID=UPI0039C9B41D